MRSQEAVWLMVPVTLRLSLRWQCPRGTSTRLFSNGFIWSRDAKLVVTVSSDKLAKVWKLKMQLKDDFLSVQKLKVISGIVGHSKDINCVDIAPNDALVATGSMDKGIKVFDLPHLTLRSTLTGHKRGIWSVQFSKTEKMVLSSSADMTIKLWSLTDDSCLRTFEGHSGSILKAVFLAKSQQVHQ